MLNSADACRGGFPCDITGLKEAMSCGAYHGPEGSLVGPIASVIDIKRRTFCDQLNPSEPDWPAAKHLDVIAKFTAAHPVIARHVARLQGGFFYRVPAGAGFDKTTATSVREFGEFLQAIASGTELLTPSKLAQVRKEGAEAMAAIKASMDVIEKRAADAGVKA